MAAGQQTWQNRIVGYGSEAPDQLLANPANWRIHPKYQQDSLTGVLDSVGWVQNVIVNKRTSEAWDKERYVETVVDGHLRIALAISHDEPEVPITYVDLTPSEEALILASIDPISAMAATDKDQLEALLRNVNSDNAAVQQLLSDLAVENGIIPAEPIAAPDAQIDRAEELLAKWGCKRGDLYVIPSKSGKGEHRLFCGDSTNADDVARVMLDDKPRLMVTDPPYGVDYDPEWRNEAAEKGLIAFASGREGVVANDDRVDWSEAWKLSPSDVVYCWHADRHASAVQVSLEAANYEIRSQIIWAKPRFVISRGHYHWQHEPCWYAVKKGATAEWQGDRSQTTLWEIPMLDDTDQKSHGTQKPTECMARGIRNHSGDVYDPFGGSGTTMVACEQLGRQCRMIELEPKYCAVILQRMSDMSLEPRLVE